MTINTILAQYSTISLAELNAKAEMLARLDNKYIISMNNLDIALTALRADFDVLDIKGERSFIYATRYFDDEEYRAYYDHHQRRRKRCKVRIRTYVGANLDFLEVKVIEPRGTTAKTRLQLEKSLMQLDQKAIAFVNECHRNAYGTPFTKHVEPVLLSQYERITLVAKEGGERLTIDTNLQLSGAGRHRIVDPDICIVETKSARGNGVADKIFRSLHVQPTGRVSKFCIGMVATGQVNVRNGFLPALRKLDLVDPVFPLPALQLCEPLMEAA
jgi:VTC domain